MLILTGQGIAWIWSNNSSKPAQPMLYAQWPKTEHLVTFQNMTEVTCKRIQKGACLGILRCAIQKWSHDKL